MFSKKKKVLEKSVRPTTTSDQCWLEEYSLKSGVPPSIAFIKARSVYQGHITVQDTSFAKIGLHIPVQESQPVMNISSGHFVINSSYPHCVLVPKTAEKVKKMCPFLCPALTPSNGRWLHAFSSEHSKCIFIQALSEVLPKCIKRELLEKSMMSKTFEIQLSEKKWERVRWVDRVPLLTE